MHISPSVGHHLPYDRPIASRLVLRVYVCPCWPYLQQLDMDQWPIYFLESSQGRMLLPCYNTIWSNLSFFKVTDTALRIVHPYVLSLTKPNSMQWCRFQFTYISPDSPSGQTYPHLSSDSVNLHVLPVWAGTFPVPLSLIPDWYQTHHSKSNLSWSKHQPLCAKPCTGHFISSAEFQEILLSLFYR